MRRRLAVRAPPALATVWLAVVALSLAEATVPVPGAPLPSGDLVPESLEPAVALSTGPLALVLAVGWRAATTREPTHIVLVALAVPTLLATGWAFATSYAVDPGGMAWAPFAVLVTWSLLSAGVLVDSLIGAALGQYRSAGA